MSSLIRANKYGQPTKNRGDLILDFKVLALIEGKGSIGYSKPISWWTGRDLNPRLPPLSAQH
ncbi:MAG: hypothetical protein ACE5L6_05685, partial [Candidatus Bathyarchaeia archaeon]